MEVLDLWHHYRWYIIPVCVSTLALFRYFICLKEKVVYPGNAAENVKLAANKDEVIVSTHKPTSRIVAGNSPKIVDSASREHAKSIRAPQRVNRSQKKHKIKAKATLQSTRYVIKPIIFYFSLTGTTKSAANHVATQLGKLTLMNSKGFIHRITKADIHDLAEIEYDDFFINNIGADERTKYLYLLLIPTYDIDTLMNTYLQYLEETHHDFRIDTAPLRRLLGYSVFGFGDRELWPTEKSGFCTQAIRVDKWFAKLTGQKRAFPLGLGNVKGDVKDRLDEWIAGVSDILLELLAGRNVQNTAGNCSGSEGSDSEVAEELEKKSSDAFITSQRRKKNNTHGTGIDDLEDIGRKIIGLSPSATSFEKDSNINLAESDINSFKPLELDVAKEMVPKTSSTYAALVKQGYSIVGSHSGVKICRWTKSALRGRGSCYKYTFYGIQSHLCMETTPSLSCSNKCVFCWRHGTNPVGTTWRWQVNPPEMIFEGVKAGHYQKIKMMKGVPGVRAERFAEAMRIRHCALSLVGEPIFYPHINEFVALLHAEQISSFLVCNAQHPDHLARLDPVTQLYVSIDASNKESLRQIDRPLHRDFWERFCRCLDILREKRFRQRTVFRLTLVKGFNIDDEVEGYADLVARGQPCFVEIKGVTYCGTSTSSAVGLTMQNVPFYEEITEFVVALDRALTKRGLDYGIAAEHAHSCCALIASGRFRKNGQWCTLIDYDKFFQCLRSNTDFSPEDYMGEPTPEWALWGNGGFNPEDERFYRKGAKARKESQ